MKILSKFATAGCLLVAGLAGFSLTAHAANAVSPTDGNVMLDSMKTVYQAIQTHQWSLTGALVVMYLVAIVKRYLGDRVSFLHSDAGGSLLALVGAVATAIVSGLSTPDAHVTGALMLKSLQVGVAAAGGYAMLKNLLVDPVLKPLVAKLPPWAQAIVNVALFAFDHGPSAATASPAIVSAEKAGAVAVATAPGPGVAGIVGEPADAA